MTLTAVEKVLNDSAGEVVRLKQLGKPIIGYWCGLTPVELVSAAGAIPYRIGGRVNESQDAADNCIEAQMCGFVRGCFDLGLKGEYSFLDGLIMPYCCNSTDTLHSFWKHYVKVPNVWVINSPHIINRASVNFLVTEFLNLKSNLEELTGRQMSDADLSSAIQIHNQKRSLLRNISLLKKLDPPPISGREMLEVALASTHLPPEEAVTMLQKAGCELKARKTTLPNRPRLMVFGMSIDDPAVLELIEDCGANVVAGLFCPDIRTYWHQVQEESASPVEVLASYYLSKIVCSRTYEEGREGTIGFARELGREFNIQGCIVYRFRYCDCLGTDMPDFRDQLGSAGIRVLGLDMDYTLFTSMGARVRIEAFVESLNKS